MTPVFLRPDADLDVRETIHWYEAQAPGLGRDFLNSLSATFEKI